MYSICSMVIWTQVASSSNVVMCIFFTYFFILVGASFFLCIFTCFTIKNKNDNLLWVCFFYNITFLCILLCLFTVLPALCLAGGLLTAQRSRWGWTHVTPWWPVTWWSAVLRLFETPAHISVWPSTAVAPSSVGLQTSNLAVSEGRRLSFDLSDDYSHGGHLITKILHN